MLGSLLVLLEPAPVPTLSKIPDSQHKFDQLADETRKICVVLAENADSTGVSG